jgi:hypothetical protein
MLRTVGNIDFLNRPLLFNADGSISTTLSFSVNLDGVEVLLPSVINGIKVRQSVAVAHYRATGEHLGIFDTAREADRYAERLHEFQVMVLVERGLLPRTHPLVDPRTRMRSADQVASKLHDLIYQEPFDRQAASDAVWEVHSLLREPNTEETGN